MTDTTGSRREPRRSVRCETPVLSYETLVGFIYESRGVLKDKREGTCGNQRTGRKAPCVGPAICTFAAGGVSLLGATEPPDPRRRPEGWSLAIRVPGDAYYGSPVVYKRLRDGVGVIVKQSVRIRTPKSWSSTLLCPVWVISSGGY